jgi:hypothetical protein
MAEQVFAVTLDDAEVFVVPVDSGSLWYAQLKQFDGWVMDRETTTLYPSRRIESVQLMDLDAWEALKAEMEADAAEE